MYRQYIYIWCRQNQNFYCTKVNLLHCLILSIQSYITIIHFTEFISKINSLRTPNALPQSRLWGCLILFFLFFLLAFLFLFDFLFLFKIFFLFFIFTTTTLFIFHMMTKLLHQFYMTIIHIMILSTEPFSHLIRTSAFTVLVSVDWMYSLFQPTATSPGSALMV